MVVSNDFPIVFLLIFSSYYRIVGYNVSFSHPLLLFSAAHALSFSSGFVVERESPRNIFPVRFKMDCIFVWFVCVCVYRDPFPVARNNGGASSGSSRHADEEMLGKLNSWLNIILCLFYSILMFSFIPLVHR